MKNNTFKKKSLTLTSCLFGLVLSSTAFAGWVHVQVQNIGNQATSFYFPAGVWVLNVPPHRSVNALIPQNTTGIVFLSYSPNKKGLVSCGQYQFTNNGSFSGNLVQTAGQQSIACNYQ